MALLLLLRTVAERVNVEPAIRVGVAHRERSHHQAPCDCDPGRRRTVVRRVGLLGHGIHARAVVGRCLGLTAPSDPPTRCCFPPRRGPPPRPCRPPCPLW